ncbi:MAG: hypothetical protein ACM3O7_00610 [Acidobacteriota bacterium]
MSRANDLDLRAIFRFWAPLAATWFMMAGEGPFVAAFIARRPGAESNLAAFGVALAIAMFIEAPVIMMMSASTALVQDRPSFLALRRFSWSLNVMVTAVIVLLLLPPVFRFLALRAIELPPEVARLAWSGTAILVPWPAAIGYRRFYQGLLIRRGLTRRVAYGTVVRLTTMAATATTLAVATSVPGVVVGAAALSLGVVCEAVAARVMARRAVAEVWEKERGEALRVREIVRFYVPLALTSMLTLGVYPVITFFVGRSRLALESLAVLPVLNGLVFIHRSPGLAFQEVAIALQSASRSALRRLQAFAGLLGVATSGVLAVIAFTPLAGAWFEGVSGLSPALARLALLPLRILVLLPALEVLLSLQRALLVTARRTRRITAATLLEVAVLVAALAIGTGPLAMVGVTATACAAMLGRLAANSFLAATSGAARSSPAAPTADG